MTGALLASTVPPVGLNTSWYLDVNHLARRTAWAHGFMHAFALWLGLAVLAVMVVVVAIVAVRRRDRRSLVVVALGGLGSMVAFAANIPLGHLVDETRPYVTHPSALVLVGKVADASFPSDHTTIAGALVVGLWWANRRVGIAAAVVALFLAFARVYVGAHYPVDVVVGLLWGGAISAVVIAVLRAPVTAGLGHLARVRGLSFLATREELAPVVEGAAAASGASAHEPARAGSDG